MSGPVAISLPADFYEPTLAALQSVLNEKLNNGDSVCLNTEGVEGFDAAALQFLLCFLSSGHASYPLLQPHNDDLLRGFKDIGSDEEILVKLFGRETLQSGVG